MFFHGKIKYVLVFNYAENCSSFFRFQNFHSLLFFIQKDAMFNFIICLKLVTQSHSEHAYECERYSNFMCANSIVSGGVCCSIASLQFNIFVRKISIIHYHFTCYNKFMVHVCVCNCISTLPKAK